MTTVIVCGVRDEALRLVEQMLDAGAEVTVVEDRPAAWLSAAVQQLGARLLAGDPRQQDVLERAGIQEASVLVCVESDDLHTLATALLARELRPELRIVVNLRNAAVGAALADLGVEVLDVAALAAGSVADACLDTRARTLQLGADPVRVLETQAPRDGTLRDLYGDLMPLVAGGRPMPGRDTTVHRGDQVVLVGSPEAIAAWEPKERRVTAYIGARAPRQHTRRQSLLRAVAEAADLRVKLAFLALGLLVVLSVTMLMVGYREPNGSRMSPLDALYFTVETIGTVGFGDFYFRDQADWLRVWAIALMMVGAALATVFFALLTNIFVSRGLTEALGRRRITGLEGHVVVVGAGSVGVAVAGELRRRGVSVVVVDADPQNRFLGRLAAEHVPVVAGDATLRETLLGARVEHARAVAVMTSDDLANIETGLAVRSVLGEGPVVLRIFDRRLARTVAASFGFDEVRSPALLAAPWFVGAALGFVVEATFYIGGEPMLVGRTTIPVGSPLDGRPLREIGAGIMVASVDRGPTRQITPRGHVTLRAGDDVYLIGPYGELLRVLAGR